MPTYLRSLLAICPKPRRTLCSCKGLYVANDVKHDVKVKQKLIDYENEPLLPPP